ncbi:glycosyltransferase family 4 protein [Candidatus Wolfebacteria bacterium]|nr:glycosyltransferase family 4 protein [Candidatus Wolfebacteria bacterium]
MRKNGVDVRLVEFKKKNLLGKLMAVANSLWQTLVFRPDYFFCSHINFRPIASFCSKIFKVPYILLTYGIDVWGKPSESEKNFVENSKLATTISNFTKNKLLNNYSGLENKIFILPNSIDISEFYPKDKNKRLVEKYNLEGKKVIFTLTRLSALEKYKGYDKMIEALPAILEKIPNIFYIIGGSGDDRQRILDLVEKRGLENYIALVGYVRPEELVDYYNLCDVFAMPSKGEGFGFVFLEALACGKPVIAGNQDGSIDAVLDGRVGVLVNPDNIDEISKALIDVLSGNIDKKLVDSDFLIKTINEAYGIEKFNKKVILLINELQR